MIELIRKGLPSPAWRLLRGMVTVFAAPIALSVRTGHWRTALAGRIVDPDGMPMPWFTYSMPEFLRTKDFAGLRVLEFGGGHSTLWWVGKGALVTVIEPNQAWAAWIRSRTAGLGVQVHHAACDNVSRDMREVIALLASFAHFDVIVIDGYLRQECAVASAEHLAPNGAMIIDNFETMDFFGIVSRPGCRMITFAGHTADGLPSSTVLLFWGDCGLLKPRSISSAG